MNNIKFTRKEKIYYEQFTMRFEEDLLDRIRAISKKEDISINEIVNQCIKYALKDYEE